MEDLKIKLQQLLNQQHWTIEEKQWLLKYLENTDTDQLRVLLEENYKVNLHSDLPLQQEISQQMLDNIHAKMKPGSAAGKVRILRTRTIRMAAASLIGLLVLGAYWQWNSRKADITRLSSPVKRAAPSLVTDIPPGGDKAVLTLADGSAIVLGDANNGALARQGNTRIVKLGGKLSYDAAGAPAAEVLYNTIATPRGGQYEVDLPDGSKVWLDASSSLRFPTAFAGKERRVEITGEAYFEVAHNQDMPFIVKVGSSEVQVLGTHFNIMAYAEEAALKTTLLEGSVRFVNGSNASLLVPGQQAQLNKDGRQKVENGVDVGEVMAWKNGLFHFENADIETVMRQLSRWYDVEISYRDRRAGNLFFADIPRSTNLSDALKALMLTGKVHFEIQGKKIIVEE
jgi:transmembrane sensor